MQSPTIFHRVVIAMLACVICGLRVSGQEVPVDDAGASQPASATAPENPTPAEVTPDTKMPDITGTWRYERLYLTVSEKFDSIGTRSARAVVTRIEGSDSEFEVRETHETGESRWLVKWSSDNRRFEQRVPGADNTTQITTALQPLAGGRTIQASFYLDAKSIEKVEFFNPSAELTKFLTPVWKRVPSAEEKTPNATTYDSSDRGSVNTGTGPTPPAATPEKAATVDAASDSQMPDISGTWGPYGPNEAIIRRTENGKEEFEMSFQLCKQYVRQENHTDPPPLLLKWVPESQHFQTVYVVRRGRTTYSLKLQPDGKSMEVCSLPADPHTSTFFLIIKIRSDTRTSLATADDSKGGICIEDFKLANTSADKLVRKLSVLFPNAMIAAYARTNHIIAAADREQLEFISNVVRAEDADAEKVFSVANGSAAEYAKMLSVLNPDLKVTADEQPNSIVVTADKERMKAVEALLLKLDETATKPAQAKSDLNRGISIQGTPIGLPGPPHLPNGPPAGLDWKPGQSNSKSPERKPQTFLPPSDSPEARKLAEHVAEHEALARLLADEIRGLSQKLGPKHPKLVETRRQLDEALANALAAKFKLEQLQITSLEERLIKLKTQIGQRQSLSKQIIERRARELIEGDALKWTQDVSHINREPRSNASGETPLAQEANTSVAANPAAMPLRAKARQAMNEGRMDEARQLLMQLRNKSRNGQYDDLRDSELIEANRDPASELGIPVPSRSMDAGTESILPNDEQRENHPELSQIFFSHPEKMVVQFGDGANPGDSIVTPALRYLWRDRANVTRRLVRFINVASHRSVPFVGVLDIYPGDSKSTAFLDRRYFPLEISKEEADHAMSGNPVLKVVYLHTDDNSGRLESAAISSVGFNPHGGLLKAAGDRGSIVAVLRFARDRDTLGLTPEQIGDGSKRRIEKHESEALGDLTAKAVNAESPAALKPNVPEFNSVSASELTTQIHISGPKGVEALYDEDRGNKPTTVSSLPLRRNFVRPKGEVTRHSIGFKNVTNHTGTRFLGVLELYPEHPTTADFLAHNAIPFVITDEDFDQAVSKKPGFVNPVTKIVYMPNPFAGTPAVISVETLVSTRLDPGVDLIEEAKRRGSILAVFGLYESGPPTISSESQEADANTPTQKPAPYGPPSAQAERRSQLPSEIAGGHPTPTYQEFAKKLGTMDSAVAEADEKLKSVEKQVEKGYKNADDLTSARRAVAEAIRNRKALQDEYAAVLRDLELQIQSAEVEADSAKRQADQVKELIENGLAPQQKHDDAQLRQKQSTLALERLKVRYDLYKKAGEAVPKAEASTPLSKVEQAPDTAKKTNVELASKQVWDRIGMKFGEPVTAEKLGSKGKQYRGGLSIIEVRDSSPNGQDGVRKGDVLVGLEKWETTSLDNVVWILHHLRETFSPDQKDRPVKCVVVRNGETHYGFLRVADQTVETPKTNPSPQ